jgi:hypothetical protein
MVNEYGYTSESAEETIMFAANNLWRDSWDKHLHLCV